ncbi:MAG: ion channel [Sphingomicrobium sp.]
MDLALQLLAATFLIVLATLVHGTGVVITSKLFQYEDRALKGRKLAFREFHLMVPMALCLLGLHALEICVFAVFYIAVGEIASFEEALYVSASAYTTLGISEGSLVNWKLVGVFEGLAGFLLIGWSAAVFVADMERILRQRQG